MATVGKLEQTADGISGKLITYLVAARMMIGTERGTAKDGTPIHSVLVKAPHGAYAEVGIAFRRTVGKGEFAGAPMFNIVFHEETDFPFKSPVTAWPRKVPGQGMMEWELTLDRPRQDQAAPAPADACPV